MIDSASIYLYKCHSNEFCDVHGSHGAWTFSEVINSQAWKVMEFYLKSRNLKMAFNFIYKLRMFHWVK